MTTWLVFTSDQWDTILRYGGVGPDTRRQVIALAEFIAGLPRLGDDVAQAIAEAAEAAEAEVDE